ncbi:MAG: tetratricopeptide repeat protein [Sedimentisphaerales bacterium]|jgi:tetratricopeptide (TPR) repeat protein
MNERLYNHRRLLICILLAAVTFVVYLPVRNYSFLFYDDNVYVSDNAQVKVGLNWHGIKWAFTTGYGSNWHPLTWLSLMLDCELFGVKSGPMHIVNVLFHIANSILLFLVLARMTKGLWQSAFIAGLFALHPLHVESVAWVAERKDVLSTLFWLLTMLAYAWYVERPSARRYIAVPVLFAIGLLAKPMLVTLPFVLLLLDYWPLGRTGGQITEDGRQKASLKRLIIEKIPLIVLSAASSVITFLVQRAGGSMLSIYAVHFSERISNAIVSYVSYISKMFLPVGLAILYPHPANRIPAAKALICAAILILITIICLYYARRRKYLLVGWLWYLGTLVPVIGIVQVGSQGMADRYTYIPLIGLFLIIAFAGAELLKKISMGTIAAGVTAGVILSACGITATAQVRHWKDSLTLFKHAIDVTENNYLVENNYANVLSNLGRNEEALTHLVEALRFLPDSPEMHSNFGNILKKTGKFDQAIEQYEIALKLNPDFSLARYQLGVTLAAKGDYEGAIKQYRLYACTAADLADICKGPGTEQGKVNDAANQFHIVRPDSTEVRSNFGYALAQSGKPKEAIEYYDRVLAKDPNNVITQGRLALALAAIGSIDEAIEHCRIVIAARPDDAEMQNNLGMLLQRQDKTDEAIECYKKALQIDPKLQNARENLDSALAQKQAGK